MSVKYREVSVPGLKIFKTKSGFRAVFELFGTGKRGSTRGMSTVEEALGHAYHIYVDPSHYFWSADEKAPGKYVVSAEDGDMRREVLYVGGLSYEEAKRLDAALLSRGVKHGVIRFIE